jgi:hypothetical protein
MKITLRHKPSAFTLVETVTAMACGTIVLAALLAASIALQRSFAAVEGYSIAEGDQLRVQDYIAMDCRRATGGAFGALATTPAVDNGSWVGGSWVHNAAGALTLIVLVPDYYDANGNSQAPYFVNGKIQYGDAGTTPISYYQSGSSFMRQVGTSSTVCAAGAAWANCAKAIATNVSSFTVSPLDQTDNKVSCSITFKPSFTSLPGPGPIVGTTVYSQTFLRNAVARQ